MSNPLIASPALSDAATISTSNTEESSAVGIANVQTMQPTEFASLAPASGDVTIDVDFGTATAWNTVWLGFTNVALGGGTTWKVTGGTTQGATDVYNPSAATLPAVGATASMVRTHGLWRTTVSSRWVRITIIDAPAPYTRIGRLYVANAHQFAHGYAYDGTAPGYDDVSIRTEAETRTFTRALEAKPVFDLDLSKLTVDEAMSTLPELQRTRAGRDVLLVSDPDDATYLHERAKYGLFGARIRTPHRFHQEYSARLTVEGLL